MTFGRYPAVIQSVKATVALKIGVIHMATDKWYSKAPAPAPRLLDQVRDAIRRKHYSLRTEQSYVFWIKRYILFHDKRHPKDLGEADVTKFLNHLARAWGVAASTQNQALSALLFLYKAVLLQPLPWLDDIERVKRPARVPAVLTQGEVRDLLSHLEGTKWIMASLIYGAGLRLRECLKLRVKDIELGYRQVIVRDGKGGKDRVTTLPEKLIDPLQQHLVPRKGLARKGSCRRLRGCRIARRAFPEVSGSGVRARLEVRLSVAQTL